MVKGRLLVTTNYYVLGSKYEEEKNNWVDMLPEMRKNGVVSVGWLRKRNLKRFYDKPGREIVDYLLGIGQPPKCYNTFKYFLQLKPGDLIAIKDSGSPIGNDPFLSIRAYAVVTERDGIVYGHERRLLGHTINVEFIEIPELLELPRGGYGRTIHRLKNQEHISEIFQFDVKSLDIVDPHGDEESDISTNQQPRKGSKPYIADAAHNILQKQFYRYLSNKYGKENLSLEKNYVDIILRQDSKSTLFEIKPYNSANQCVRAALGQLMHYSYKYTVNESTPDLVIVGPAEPSWEEIDFIKFVQNNMNIPIKYICYSNRRSTEY